MVNIMVVEDDLATRKLLVKTLLNNDFNVYETENGQEALEKLASRVVNLFIVDLMMPEMDGFEFIKQVRDLGINAPILILTAKSSINDKRRCFELGADDYLVKSIDNAELIMRVNALLRRANINSSKKLEIGKVVLDYDGLTVTRDDEVTTLPKKEFYLLFKLLSYPNTVFTKEQLMNEIWGMDSDTDEKTIKVHVQRLRQKFENYDEFEIINVRGLGYKAVKHDEAKRTI